MYVKGIYATKKECEQHKVLFKALLEEKENIIIETQYPLYKLQSHDSDLRFIALGAFPDNLALVLISNETANLKPSNAEAIARNKMIDGKTGFHTAWSLDPIPHPQYRPRL